MDKEKLLESEAKAAALSEMTVNEVLSRARAGSAMGRALQSSGRRCTRRRRTIAVILVLTGLVLGSLLGSPIVHAAGKKVPPPGGSFACLSRVDASARDLLHFDVGCPSDGRGLSATQQVEISSITLANVTDGFGPLQVRIFAQELGTATLCDEADGANLGVVTHVVVPEVETLQLDFTRRVLAPAIPPTGTWCLMGTLYSQPLGPFIWVTTTGRIIP
jgi:hypothetical protein